MIYTKDGKMIFGDIPPFVQIFHDIVGIGDSLMCGYASTADITIPSVDAKAKGANWLSYMGLDIGRTPVNLAVGNTSTHDWRYVRRGADIGMADGITADCYIIGLGVNDSRHDEEVGTSADIAEEYTANGDSFYGNMDFIIHKLHEYNPNAHIFIFTIPGNETKKIQINEGIRYITGLYAYTHCIDLAEKYGEEYTTGFIPANYHGGHYNALTYRLMSSYIQQAMSEYIFKNYTLFKNVPYQL